MIALVEDDAALGRSLARGLAAQGWRVEWVRTAAALRGLLDAGEVDVVVLDRGLPDGDGLELCRAMRARGQMVPVLMLTARATLDDRLDGFAAGADDYLPKPFAFAELLARVRVLRDRAARMRPDPVCHAGFTCDPASGRIGHGDGAIAWGARLEAVLAALITARGAVVARDALIAAAWGAEAEIGDNSLDVAISTLRRRLRALDPALGVRAVRGQGFALEQADDQAAGGSTSLAQSPPPSAGSSDSAMP